MFTRQLVGAKSSPTAARPRDDDPAAGGTAQLRRAPPVDGRKDLVAARRRNADDPAEGLSDTGF